MSACSTATAISNVLLATDFSERRLTVDVPPEICAFVH